MNNADLYRKKIINNILSEGVSPNNRVSLDIAKSSGVYKEIITLNEISEITNNYSDYPTVLDFLNELSYNRIGSIIKEVGLSINENEFDLTSSDNYDGYELTIPLINENYNPILELFNEIDSEINPELKNVASNVPITKEPFKHKVPNIPIDAKKRKTQNPKRVDLILKNLFNNKFLDHIIRSDAGDWKVKKTLNKDGKLLIIWESVKEPSITIECLLFPKDTNKVLVDVKNSKGETLLETFFEIYRIPTQEFIGEKFFKKTLFSLLKKYIDTFVIQIPPYNTEFIFWKTDNPSFSYSFSTPNKNKILLNLINFIGTARKPILDDFFEANNLKHKQGYLQTLLDSAEAAGIFKFKREGNEILILRGPNYKAFLEGKVRRYN